jgi:plasmid stability protein
MKRLVLELDDELHQKIKVKSIKEKKSMREVLTSLLMAWLKKG